jgi:hypothetical protein
VGRHHGDIVGGGRPVRRLMKNTVTRLRARVGDPARRHHRDHLGGH